MIFPCVKRANTKNTNTKYTNTQIQPERRPDLLGIFKFEKPFKILWIDLR